jgi:tellurite resistance protein TerA
MEIGTKNSEVQLDAVKQVIISLKWTSAEDYDIAAYYTAKDGSSGLLYFGGHQNTGGRGNTSQPQIGNLNEFPFMQLDGDEGIGDYGGDNEETMRVASIDEMDSIWVLCWDYGAVADGSPARFSDSDLTVSWKDDAGTAHDVKFDASAIGNMAAIAKIDHSSPEGPKLINFSEATTLKGLNFDGIKALCQ